MPIQTLANDVRVDQNGGMYVGAEWNADVTRLTNGNIVVTWFGPGAGYDMYYRVFDSNGVPLTGQLVANNVTASDQVRAHVTALGNGNFMIFWEDYSTPGDGQPSTIKARIFNADGTPTGPEFVANSTIQSYQDNEGAFELEDGGIVIAWYSGDPRDPDGGVVARIFNADGTPRGNDFLLNTTTSGFQAGVEIGALADGGFVAIWYGRARLFNADGTPRANDFAITAGGDAFVAGLAGGGFVVTSGGTAFLYSNSGAFISSFAFGSPSAEAAALDDGTFVIAWTNGSGVFVQHYTANGVAKFAQPYQIAPGASYHPHIHTLADGKFVVQWTSGGKAYLEILQTDFNARAVANDDVAATTESAPVSDNVFENNGSGADSDAEGDSFQVTAVNGDTTKVGQQVTLPSGALLTLNADGTYTYDPNGAFDSLVSASTAAATGASNSSATDSFTYTVTGGDTATVTITITGEDGAGDRLGGSSGDDAITGTPDADFFMVRQGGNDDLDGQEGDDVFFFGGAMTGADKADGGAGTDQIALQGDYSGGVTFGTGIVGIENLAILPGSDTRFGDPGTNFYDYNITLRDVNVAAGVRMVIDANRLRAGEDFTFNGSAESDGSFFIYGGGGVDNLTGGDRNDVFLFGAQGQWGASDRLVGGIGTDQLALRGDYTITFGATQLVGIEQIGLVSAHDTRFGAVGDSYDYDLTMNDGNVDSFRMTVDASPLRSDETLTFNGSAEDDGSFRVFGGAGADVISGSQNGDIIFGGGRGDTLTGGGGNDVFAYRSTGDSNSAERDGIQDFTLGDLVDLSRIDANVLVAGDQAFAWIGSAAFSNTAGELRFENISLGGPIWLVQGDVDGNGGSDFELVLVITDAHPLTANDFVL